MKSVLCRFLICACSLISIYCTLVRPPHARRTTALFSADKGSNLKTYEMFGRLQTENNVGGAGGSSNLDGLKRLDETWQKLKNGGWQVEPDAIVFPHTSGERGVDSSVDAAFDIIVSGGTLGIFYALALQNLGFKTCIVERGKVVGRTQEWNICMNELKALIRLGILTEEDITKIVGIEFNPNRVGFKVDTSGNADKAQGFEVYVQNILNLGVKPNVLIELVKNRFLSGGGTLFEDSPLTKIDVYTDMAIVNLGSKRLSTRLVLDAMGNSSPIAKQIRGPVEPDGICVVVGGCASGFDPKNNTYSDVIYTDTPITAKATSQLQYFWEAFPAGSGPSDRTTYLFSYMDADPGRPSIMEIMEDYWKLLPRYQGVNVDDLKFSRILYGMFPTYRDSPLQAGFDRILQVGDASGIQSPLSFGGFGSLTRHIERIVGAIDDALAPDVDPLQELYPNRIYEREDLINTEYLGMINSYQPNLRVCWMFQRAMSVRVGDRPDPGVIVGTLKNSFSAMEKLGDPIMRPFLQDVLQFVPLLRTLTLAAGQDPLTPLKVVPQVGLPAMLDFLIHFSALGVYTLLASTVGPSLSTVSAVLPRKAGFKVKRMAESFKFGSGLDYYDHV